MPAEFVIILTLILVNALFAMAEMAVVASRKSRLAAETEAGSRRARIALELAEDPSQLLSTVQIGITLVGIVTGVYGAATIAADLEAAIAARIPTLAAYAYPISYGTIVVGVTYLSVVIGELLPKRLALAFPERIAVGLAPLLRLTMGIFRPFVFLLDRSTRLVLWLIPIKLPDEQSVTEEDVRRLIEEGAEQGIIESGETEVLKRTLKLGERPIQSIMTPRVDSIWIDIENSPQEIWSTITTSPHSYFPVCRGRPEHFLGILRAKTLAIWQAGGYSQPIEDLIQQPTKLYSGMPILDALAAFRREKNHFAIVIDEHGSIDGIVTTHDLLEAIVGDLPEDPNAQPLILERDDGSLLVDGWLDIDELSEYLKISRDSLHGDGSFRTVGGLVTWKLAKMPSEGDSVIVENYKFEVIDMDRHRVDKVVITPQHRELDASSARYVPE